MPTQKKLESSTPASGLGSSTVDALENEGSEPKPKDDIKDEIGYAVTIKNYLVMANGLPRAKIDELVIHHSGSRALVTGLNEDDIQLVMLDDTKVKPHDQFTRTNDTFTLPLGDHLLGRTINPLGIPIDSKMPFPKMTDHLPLNPPPPKLVERQFITDQFLTGLSTIDLLVPIAKGQRQLIIGDARSGKTSFIIDTIVHQTMSKSDRKMIIVYALIGKPVVEIRRLIDVLAANKALAQTVLVATSSSDLASLIYVTPLAAFTVAEYFRKRGNDVLIVLDDLGVHAKFYREMALLQNQAPGRESYPGDIFYQHAKLLERAGNFAPSAGGGSITALPVVEVNLDNLTSFIPTNLMAMTDGHFIFDSKLYHQGHRPAIDISLSVSRVGRQTQGLMQKELSDKIKSVISQAQRLQTLARLGSDLSPQTKQMLLQNEQIEVLLSQAPLTTIPKLIQMVLLGLVFTPFLANQRAEFVSSRKTVIVDYLMTKIDTNKLAQQVDKMTDLNQFLGLVNTIAAALQKAIK